MYDEGMNKSYTEQLISNFLDSQMTQIVDAYRVEVLSRVGRWEQIINGMERPPFGYGLCSEKATKIVEKQAPLWSESLLRYWTEDMAMGHAEDIFEGIYGKDAISEYFKNC